MIKIEHVKEDDGTHRIIVTSDDATEDGELGNVDKMVFTFSDEGLVIDADENGVIVGTESATFSEIVDRLEPQ